MFRLACPDNQRTLVILKPSHATRNYESMSTGHLLLPHETVTRCNIVFFYKLTFPGSSDQGHTGP